MSYTPLETKLRLEILANRGDGPKDRELPDLFAGIDPIAERIFNKSVGL